MIWETVSQIDPRLVLERTCEANLAGEDSSFIFTVYVKFVPPYHFKLAYVVLHMAVKNFRNLLLKMEKQAVLIFKVISDQP